MFLATIAGPTVGLAHHELFGASGHTWIHPVVFVAMVAAVILIFALPRKDVLAPLLITSMLSPPAQMLMIGAFHFQVPRLLLIFVWIRLLWERYGKAESTSRLRMNAADIAVILYAVVSVICYTLLWKESAAFVNEVGKAYNILGFYFAFRFFIRNRKDVERTIGILAVTAAAIAVVMLNEQLTGHNLLAAFGGVPENTVMRNGYLRAQGPFGVYLTAGAFGATLFPLALCLWHKGGSRVLAALGMGAAVAITVSSGTSTAIVTILAAFSGLGMWFLRYRMRTVRWMIVGTLVALELAMKAPVWALIARIDIIGGSTGWHRYKIVDNFIRHFPDWWLLGSNSYWTWEGGDDMWDTANQYVYVGETSGLLSFVFFLATIVYSFKYLGGAIKRAKGNYREAWFFWLLGVALFSNLVAFFGIGYFDQSSIYWYALLAMIVSVAAPVRKPVRSAIVVKYPRSALGGQSVGCE